MPIPVATVFLISFGLTAGIAAGLVLYREREAIGQKIEEIIQNMEMSISKSKHAYTTSGHCNSEEEVELARMQRDYDRQDSTARSSVPEPSKETKLAHETMSTAREATSSGLRQRHGQAVLSPEFTTSDGYGTDISSLLSDTEDTLSTDSNDGVISLPDSEFDRLIRDNDRDDSSDSDNGPLTDTESGTIS
ncbi:uncharacterized protein V1518DRAFT_413577, partial [Limtongia smithiae]|uniref:uncharacterized protein n=1 Tax=Limtongia smithiae TaxID=1125753 RepID=UPI0034CFCCB6